MFFWGVGVGGYQFCQTVTEMYICLTINRKQIEIINLHPHKHTFDPLYSQTRCYIYIMDSIAVNVTCTVMVRWYNLYRRRVTNITHLFPHTRNFSFDVFDIPGYHALFTSATCINHIGRINVSNNIPSWYETFCKFQTR